MIASYGAALSLLCVFVADTVQPDCSVALFFVQRYQLDECFTTVIQTVKKMIYSAVAANFFGPQNLRA